MKTATKKRPREKLLVKVLSLIKENPRIRPSDINRRINRKHSATLRNILIKKGLIRKQRKGSAVYYYPVKQDA